MPDLETANDPFAMAQDFQMELMDRPFDERIRLAEEALRFLGGQAVVLSDEGATFIFDFRQAFVRPRQPFGPKQRFISFVDTAAEGKLLDFSYVSIGKLVAGSRPINSLCVTLENVTMLPFGDPLPDDDILHIPALAVEQHLRVA